MSVGRGRWSPNKARRLGAETETERKDCCPSNPYAVRFCLMWLLQVHVVISTLFGFLFFFAFSGRTCGHNEKGRIDKCRTMYAWPDMAVASFLPGGNPVSIKLKLATALTGRTRKGKQPTPRGNCSTGSTEERTCPFPSLITWAPKPPSPQAARSSCGAVIAPFLVGK
ncbi:hypothetical protein BB8028_0007g04240 [Beauveria bassiana]|uniref:Uncharacterized protein n=1 Tax=Beauveria bassiana TaxID=176275 RepID=A0A2S7YMP5_BEABA|nr:hypothetical protein BB8028_0007g04240 [Beauveria bassiana]